MTTTVDDSQTTIKVPRAIHRQLKTGAGGYRSIADYIEHLLALEERQRMIEAMRVAMAASTDEQLESWREESQAWEAASLTDAR